MKRSAFLRKPDDKARLSVPIKFPKCKVCKALFERHRGFESWCSVECGATLVQRKIAAQRAKKSREDRSQEKTMREAMKTHPMLIKECQAAFNQWIRLRDAGQPCICCGYEPFTLSKRGGDWDSGHYRSVGSAPHLRFDERNVHAQKKYCNQFLGGNVVNYRRGLIERIGLAAVEELESDQTHRKYTRDELRAIRDDYRVRVRIMKKETT